ncbi:MAG: sarcosine oxidase, subunit gamma [Nocardioidaceae bacterium]|nr:sarcosine oxidase, subunit gamma [Nocardioidaceae bacterium]
MADVPVARSPIQPAPPTEVRDGWLVSVVRSTGALRLADRTPLTKVLVRASPEGRVASSLDAPFGRARHDRHGVLIVRSGPDEWLLLAAPDARAMVTSRIDTTDDDPVFVIDVTHGRALMRLSGTDGHRVLAKVCAIDLSDAVTPNGAAFRSSVADVATDVIRDDLTSSEGTVRSYLLHCERSSGQYLFDALLDAGREFGVQVDGFLLDSAFADG